MNPDQWKRLDELFHLALEREGDERAAFVAQASDGNDDLRHELEAMLAHHEQANSFIESPAYAVAAETIIEEESPEQLIGTTLGPYRVLSLLGKGGMGVVYRALDQELRRQVALKFLHSELTGDKSRVLRFKQEARAASALNQPNILTVFAIGEIDGRHYIATELVDGQTLRELMKSRRMHLSQIVSIASQISSALAAAHAAGIMHRDIKPENIMLRPDGYLKVLDFGLAKLIEPPTTDSGLSTLVNTEEGTIIGTIQYMSPEQARGLTVDERTDIWSLGVVLFEMLTGHPPFEGKTKSDVMAAILDREPAPLAALSARISEAIQDIVTKALAKDRLQRYQHAQELLTDLRQLDQSDLNADLERPLLPQVNRHLALETVKQRAKSTDDPAALRPASSAEYIVSEIKQHKLTVALTLLILTSLTAGVGFWINRLVNRSRLSSFAKTMSITRLTTSGNVKDAVVSPDGKYVAYTVDEVGKRNLRLRQVGTTSDIQIAGATDYGMLTFSRDGSYLYYKSFFQGDLCRLPSIGGPTTLVLKDVDSSISFSPDGKRFAFVRQDYPTQGESALVIANADGTGEQKLASRNGGYSDPAWSPDGKLIASVVPTSDAEGYHRNLVAVEVSGGVEKPITSRDWLDLDAVAWLSDGTGLLLLANDRSVFSQQIWQLSYPDGEARRVTNDFNNYRLLSLNADSTLLVSVQEVQPSNIWLWTNRPGIAAKQITSGTGKYFDLSWTLDGKLIYDSDAGGSWDIWSLDVATQGTRQLTASTGLNGDPSVSPDGRRVAFVSTRSGGAGIWIMDADGGRPKQLTNGNEDSSPIWSPDEKWIIFEREVSGWPTLWRLPAEGGSPIQITEKPTSSPVVSPDGKLIACTYKDDTGAGSKVVVIPFEGGPPLKSFDIPPPFFSATFKWTLDGKALTYRDNKAGVDNVWTQPLEGGPPKQLTNFTSEKIFSFAWSRDGQLAISRGVETGDVVLITDFR